PPPFTDCVIVSDVLLSTEAMFIVFYIFIFMLTQQLYDTLFPYTTLFRSGWPGPPDGDIFRSNCAHTRGVRARNAECACSGPPDCARPYGCHSIRGALIQNARRGRSGCRGSDSRDSVARQKAGLHGPRGFESDPRLQA